MLHMHLKLGYVHVVMNKTETSFYFGSVNKEPKTFLVFGSLRPRFYTSAFSPWGGEFLERMLGDAPDAVTTFLVLCLFSSILTGVGRGPRFGGFFFWFITCIWETRQMGYLPSCAWSCTCTVDGRCGDECHQAKTWSVGRSSLVLKPSWKLVDSL
jgi:hypothetical protein